MKHLIITLFLITPALLFSQDKSADTKIDLKKEPVLSIFTDLFKVKNLNFSRIRPDNTGEILETEFQLENLTNISIDLYIFVIATHEKDYIPESSFDSPDFEERKTIKLIQVYPDELSNYEYTVKDNSGAEQKIYQKYPKNIKAGIDKKTGKLYNLNDFITFRSRNFTKFMKQYYFFNQVTILIFDSEEKLLFRQNYSVNAVKR